MLRSLRCSSEDWLEDMELLLDWAANHLWLREIWEQHQPALGFDVPMATQTSKHCAFDE